MLGLISGRFAQVANVEGQKAGIHHGDTEDTEDTERTEEERGGGRGKEIVRTMP